MQVYVILSKKALQTVPLRLWFSLKKSLDWETIKLFLSSCFIHIILKKDPMYIQQFCCFTSIKNGILF